MSHTKSELLLAFIGECETANVIDKSTADRLETMLAGEIVEAPKLKSPSRHQLDDKVIFSFAGAIISAEVLNIHLLPGKVKYDLELMSGDEKTRIYNVDSLHVLPANQK